MEYVNQVLELEDWELEDRREQFIADMDATHWLQDDPLALADIVAILRVEGARIKERLIG